MASKLHLFVFQIQQDTNILDTIQIFATEAVFAIKQLCDYFKNQKPEWIENVTHLEYPFVTNTRHFFQQLVPYRQQQQGSKPWILYLVKDSKEKITSYPLPKKEKDEKDLELTNMAPVFLGFQKPLANITCVRPYLYVDQITGDLKCSDATLTFPYHVESDEDQIKWVSADRSNQINEDVEHQSYWTCCKNEMEQPFSKIHIQAPVYFSCESETKDENGKIKYEPRVITYTNTQLILRQGMMLVYEVRPENVKLPFIVPRYTCPLPLQQNMFDSYVCTLQSNGVSDTHLVISEHKHGGLLFLVSDNMIQARAELVSVSEEDIKWIKNQPGMMFTNFPMIMVDVYGRVILETTNKKTWRLKNQYPRLDCFRTDPSKIKSEFERDGSLLFDVRVYPDLQHPDDRSKDRRVRVARIQTQVLPVVDEDELQKLMV
jgi:hypothetical protein